MSKLIFNHPQVENVAPLALKPNPDNPKLHNRKQRRAIEASIRRFGFIVPIVIDDENRIVAGHGRWEAAKEAGLDEVPVIRVKFMSDADRRAFALAENRLSEMGGWDDALLKKELGALFDQGYDLEITGFSTADLDLSIEVDTSATTEEVIQVSTDCWVSRPGDLWTVGPHRLLCGNSLDPNDVERVLGGELAAMVFSDPPYGVRVNGHVSGTGRFAEFQMMSGEQTSAELTQFLRTIFRNCVRFSKPASIHYQCMDWRHIREILDAADGVYSEYKQLCVWVKSDNAGLGTFYRSQHELIFVFKSGPGKHTNNFELGQTGRYRTNVWQYPMAGAFRRGGKADLEAHPTCKNQAMVIDAIRDCSNPGELIFDPFSGSGTTLAAAHRAGRRGASIEIEPRYVDTTLHRLMAVTGVDAVLADGRTFEQVAADRRGAGDE